MAEPTAKPSPAPQTPPATRLKPGERYVNDTYTVEDGFGISAVGDHVARMVLEVSTPFTLGVTGKWGSGKTSILRRAFATLKGEPVYLDSKSGKGKKDHVPEAWKDLAYDQEARGKGLGWPGPLVERAKASLCVWYSPWQQQGSENPLVPLLLEIKAQYAAWYRFPKGVGDAARRSGEAGIALLERAIDAAAGLTLGRPVKLAEGITELARRAWKGAVPEGPILTDGQRFPLLFEDAVDTLLDGFSRTRGEAGRLIVFIDDLDRCEESAVVGLLEAIKLYLGIERCVFVLGVDEGAVASALTRHWQGRSDDSNREYLEKLFQAVVPVPAPRESAVDGFLRELLALHGFRHAAECADMLKRLLEPNPRKVKNFANSACASWALFGSQAPVPKDGSTECLYFEQRFLLFHYLRVFHRPVWRLLERQPWVLQVLRKVVVGPPPSERMSLPEEVEESDQRVLESMLVGAFAHILKDEAGKDERHRHLTIGEAVTLFNDRIDRKRSDEYFSLIFQKLIDRYMDLPSEYLCLPETKPVG